MNSIVSKMIVALYSIVFGVVGLIGPISYGPEALVYVVQSVMIVIGIVLLIPPLKKFMKLIMMIVTGVYSLIVLTGLIIIFMIPLAGILLLAVIAIPFTFSIVSLGLIKKEKISNKP